jgi:hypothetical protein
MKINPGEYNTLDILQVNLYSGIHGLTRELEMDCSDEIWMKLC